MAHEDLAQTTLEAKVDAFNESQQQLFGYAGAWALDKTPEAGMAIDFAVDGVHRSFDSAIGHISLADDVDLNTRTALVMEMLDVGRLNRRAVFADFRNHISIKGCSFEPDDMAEIISQALEAGVPEESVEQAQRVFRKDLKSDLRLLRHSPLDRVHQAADDVSGNLGKVAFNGVVAVGAAGLIAYHALRRT